MISGLAFVLLAGANAHVPLRFVGIPDNQQDYKILQEFASCMVKRFPERVHTYLGTYPFQSNARKITSATISPNCLSSNVLRISPSVLRGVISEVILTQNFPEPAANFEKVAPLRLGVKSPAGFPSDKNRFVALYGAAECLARSETRRVNVLVRSDVDSVQAKSAFAELNSAWAACNPPTDIGMITLYDLRALGAEMLYRLEQTARNGNAKVSEAASITERGGSRMLEAAE